MAYALVILEPPGQRQARTAAEGRVAYERMVRFSEELRGRGLLTLAQSLASDRSGARVRVQNRQATIVDGPFAEAREMVGGFLLLTCETRAEAMTIAQQCPAAEWATIEVRELGPCFT
ncbi:MAG TPA: YciI family protein [Steroidobacteraceae bacterium]|jgi:hypothetical protein|nr:YciI family protein [Steroidobacteraceae bacterium]